MVVIHRYSQMLGECYFTEYSGVSLVIYKLLVAHGLFKAINQLVSCCEISLRCTRGSLQTLLFKNNLSIQSLMGIKTVLHLLARSSNTVP